MENSNYSIDKNYENVFFFGDIAWDSNYSASFILTLLETCKNNNEICDTLKIDKEVYLKVYSKFKLTFSYNLEINRYVDKANEQRKRDKGWDLDGAYTNDFAYPLFNVSLTIEEVVIFYEILRYFQRNWEIYNNISHFFARGEGCPIATSPRTYFEFIHKAMSKVESRLAERVLNDFKYNMGISS